MIRPKTSRRLILCWDCEFIPGINCGKNTVPVLSAVTDWLTGVSDDGGTGTGTGYSRNLRTVRTGSYVHVLAF